LAFYGIKDEIMKYKTLLFLLVILALLSCKDRDKAIDENSNFQWKKYSYQNSEFKTNIDSLNFKLEKGIYGYIDEVFISKNDSIIFHNKFNLNYPTISKNKKGKMGCGSNMCEDSSEITTYNYYHPKYHPYYINSDLHTLQSITKSVASTIIGTAIQNHDLKGVHTNVYQFFRDYSLSDSIKRHLESTTLENILTMELGLRWKELGMSLEMETNVSEMELSNNWVSYTLQQPVEAKPGTIWNYNSGASQLLSQVIKTATNKTIDDYGNQSLFNKLNIKEYYWKQTPSKLPDTEGGLYLKAEDLAKIGLLYLQDGVWNKERLLPKNWVKDAFYKHVEDIYQDGGKEGYGYQWWLTGDESPLAVGLGYGNQILVIIPEKNIVGVIYAWNVFDNKAKYIFRDFVDILQQL